MIDIEKLENLPQREGIIKAVKCSNCQRKSYLGHDGYHRVCGKDPWTMVTRVLTHYLGQDVNAAFSHFCKLVPKYQQKMFWDRFKPRPRYYSWWGYKFFVDADNNIQNDYIHAYKGPYYLYTPDYRTHWVLKKDTPKTFTKFLCKEVQDRRFISWRWLEFYEERVVSGKRLVFESKNDPRYQRMYQEQQKSLRKKRRFERAEKLETEYCFFTKEEIADRNYRKVLEKSLAMISRYGLPINELWKQVHSV